MLGYLFSALLLLVSTAVAKNGKPVHNSSHLHDHDGSFTPDFYLRVTYENHTVACQHRMSVLVNGTSPGPPLRLPPGKTSWVRVCNDMDTYNTTMVSLLPQNNSFYHDCARLLTISQHWHGLSQRTAPFSDGSPVSQWPIAPHQCFDYEIHPDFNDSGTYFYHSHVGFQAISAAGPLIIEDFGLPPYEYDEERIVFLQDYYNKTDDAIEQGLVATPFVWSGEVNAVLVNGVGVAIGETAGEGGCELPVIDVEPGKTYRLRFVGALAISMVSFGIEGHTKMHVIGADGKYTKRHRVKHMQVTSGQRFDVLLQTKTVEKLDGKTDWTIQFETKDRPKVYTGFGVLRYSNAAPSITSAPSVAPLQLPNNTYAFLEYALEPLKPNGFPSAKEITRRVHITNQQLAESTTIWQLDGLNWTENQPYNAPPYLVDLYKNGPSAMPNYTAALANGGWDPVTRAWPAKLGEVIEIILENTGSLVNGNGGFDYHPFHMHGSPYYDCGSGNGSYDATANERRLKNYNPVLRDTTNLYRYGLKGTPAQPAGWRCWRLRVHSAGCWMLHCHILQHMIMGMQSVWIMGEWQDIARIPYSGAQGYLDFGGTAYGGQDISPVAWHNWDDDADAGE